jgi:hypothetical protein
MFYDPGCRGLVALGPLAEPIQQRLAALPGEWLEYDAGVSAIVVRHIQPTAGPSLPTVTSELVRMISEVPGPAQATISGGELLVYAEGSRLVRLRVEPGGALHIQWAHPDYAAAERRPWKRGAHALVEPKVQCLNGEVTFAAADAVVAAERVQHVADTFEGLYPEGECEASAKSSGVVTRLKDVNLDAELLVGELIALARPASLAGRIEVSSFADGTPEHYARFVLEAGGIFVQRPRLWGAAG